MNGWLSNAWRHGLQFLRLAEKIFVLGRFSANRCKNCGSLQLVRRKFLRFVTGAEGERIASPRHSRLPIGATLGAVPISCSTRHSHRAIIVPVLRGSVKCEDGGRVAAGVS